ncbi:GTPase HflX [Tumidithrix elongata RA019]|uniref:GTPase HflX n=1 Tax=Tumidithrix elongata BACA0141 TaxID=2716417 RepID=A0AAW9PUS1_9CYAN|nr:GTPase HflX [Tumidithrix elongata RA019]
MPQSSFTTPEFAQRLAAISTEIKQPICAFANRRGQVIRIGLGTPNQAKIPPLELPRYGDERLCGLRCISTSLKREPPTLADLTAMAMQRLDTLVVLTLNESGSGHVDRAYTAHLLPNTHADTDQAWQVSPPMSLDAIAKQDFLDLVIGLEEEFKREFVAQVVEESQDRVILAGLVEDRPNKDSNRVLPPPQVSLQTGKAMPYSLMELSQLVESAGGVVLDMLWQKRDRPQPQTVLGEGKVQELAIAAQTQRANLIVFDRELSPSQSRNLERQIGVRVSDRTEVILDIFAQRAQSAAGKLQVELAQLEYRLPRLSGRGQEFSRLGGGIGTRGPGETKLESDRRVIQKRITHLQQQVNQLQDQRARVRQRRIDREVPTVAIVGYTNAGKSTLLNALTKSDVFAANKLFATLDPTTRRLNLSVEDPKDSEQERKSCMVLMTDTVGFIHELPPSLMDAFRATLEEVTEADALLHVVDASHPAWEAQVAAVDRILKEMPITVGPTLMVFNKTDRVSDADLMEIEAKYPDAILISAIHRQGLDMLCQAIVPLVRYAVGEF